MTSPPNDTTTDTTAIIAALRTERDAALAREAALAEELAARDAALAQRNSEFGERIEYQAATLDVLRAMSASPGDPQPVFDLIVERARNLCEGYGATVLEFDGRLLLHRASTGIDDDPAIRDAIIAAYPKAPVRSWPIDRAVLERRLIIVDDLEAEPNLDPALRNLTHKSVMAMPLMRGEVALGALALGGRERGGFSDSQIELLKTFAEQAVIAITSAETYRALQTRTTDLQQSLEYQTATSDVLKVISRSTFDLQPVLTMVGETAARLCAADQALIIRHENGIIEMVANSGFPPEYETVLKKLGPHRLVADVPMVAYRAINERRVVHIHDVAAVSGYAVEPIKLGQQRTSLGVPLLRAGEPIGSILLARRRVEPFTDRQIELVNTFANQAVIAIENTRLLTEQQEALEQQTATAEVLQVINASPGNLAPVFSATLESATRLCDAAFGILWLCEGEHFHAAALHGAPERYAEVARVPHRPHPANPLGRMLRGERLIVSLDVAAEEPYLSGDPVRRALVDLGGARSVIQVALVNDNVLLGSLTVYRQDVRPFSDKQIALLQNFAAQAVIAIENTRLINEQREALEQQTATAEVLQVINASPGNLAPVFDAMLEKAMRLCGIAFGMMTTFDGERFHPVCWRGLPTALSKYFAEGGGPSGSSGMHAQLVGGAPLVYVADMKDEEAYRSGYPARRALVDLGGARTGLAIALRKEGVLLGTFMLYCQEVRSFSDKEMALLQNFAAQAVIAIENARLLTEQREALEQQTATAEVLQVINASPGNLAPVFDAVLEKAIRLCDSAFGVLQTYDGHIMRCVAMRGLTPEQEALLVDRPPAPGQPTGRIAGGEDVVHLSDAREQDGYRAGFGPTRDFVDQVGARTAMWVALRKDKKLLGILTIFRREVRAFADKEVALVQNFAAQAVIAMENARLLTEQREALEQQTATAEVLGVINANPGNLTPVFDTILNKAHRLCGASVGSLLVYEDGWGRVVATHGFPESVAELARQPARPLGLFLPLLHGERFVHQLDMKALEIAPDNEILLALTAHVGTGLYVPLRKDGTLLGMITAYRSEVRAFSDKEIALLESFAAQAVIAMENARLLNEVRQRQEELRITFENMGDGVAMFDETQHLVAWNGKFQEIFDLPDTLLEQHRTYEEHLRFLAARGDFGASVDTAEQVRALVASTGQPYGYERTRPDGRVIEIRRNPVADGGFVLMFSDITERKRSEAEIRAARDAAEAALRELKAAQANLIQAEKMASLGQLTAGIAHEIKNPLNFVNNFAALSVDLLGELKETAAPGFAALTEKQRAEIEEVSVMLTSNLEKITEHGKRADGIVKAMLEHSRGSSGERRVVNLNALIDEALNLAYHGARAQDQSFNIRLERDFGIGIAQIEVNPQDITRVFLNIFSNGFYAATRRVRDGGNVSFEPTLKVTTIDAGEAVEIRVRDNGTGIPADIRDKLFQPFFTTKPTGEGTGLGLSITYDIVTQQHGGNIAVDSKVGDYSEFTIRLPRHP